MSCLTDEKSAKVSLYTRQQGSQGAALFEGPPPQVSFLLLGSIIALLARAAGRLGRVYHNLIIQQLMTLGGPARIARWRLFTSWVIYYVHSQAIKQEVRLLQQCEFNSFLFWFEVLGV